MFGSMPLFSAAPPPTKEPPKNVPAPTPVRFPQCYPQAPQEAGTPPVQDGQRGTPLTALLQSVVRPNEIGHKHFEALGVHVQRDADISALIPDLSVVPDFAKWDETSYEDARRQNESTRNPINNGNKSPGIQTYIDRKRELSIDNNAAYRSVRRIPPPLGQPPTRLGNAYEFYRNLECFSGFWDDTTAPPTPWGDTEEKEPASDVKSSDEAKANGDSSEGAEGGDGDSASSASSTAVTDSESKTPVKDSSQPEIRFYRTSAGTMMPPEFRVNMITAFIKLVAYDFGCNVSTPRTEPRLYLNAPTIPAEEAKLAEQQQKQASQKQTKQQQAAQPQPPTQPQSPKQDLQGQKQPQKRHQPASYFASGCIFVFRSPQTREAARAGIVEGPLAAVSARHTTAFPEEGGDVSGTDADIDSNIDLARELVAALLTAQHRAREGRAERRLGEGEWWATKPRWGGGSGGPIGREVDAAPNTDDAVITQTGEGSIPFSGPSSGGGSASGGNGVGGSSRLGGLGGPGGLGGGPGPARSLAGFSPLSSSSSSSSSRSAAKKPRKGLAIYDNYRMVRPPGASWDKKTRFMALGRTRGADYDDVFVVSALFHHMSVVRVRVPQALLRALDGDVEARPGGDGKLPSWGRLEVVRSPWFDFFKVEDRLAAMKVVWAMMAFLMRKQEDEDVKMSDA